MAKRSLSQKEWLAMINQYLGTDTTLEDILMSEGGYGKDKIKTVKEARLAPGTWPHRWFVSDQVDYGLYSEPIYIPSLLFGRQISKGSIDLFVKDLKKRDKMLSRIQTKGVPEQLVIIDWGGTIFTAVDIHDLLMQFLPGEIVIVNFEGPQLDFAHYMIGKLGMKDVMSVLPENNLYDVFERINQPHPQSRHFVVLMSEVLEHIQSPVNYMLRIMKEIGVDDFYVANSFCTPAYGHHIPITIGGVEYFTPRTANKAFENTVHEILGMDVIPIEGYNSRLRRLINLSEKEKLNE